MKLDLTEFPHTYEVELDQQLTGKEKESVVYIPENKGLGGAYDLILKIIPKGSETWFGIFAGGYGTMAEGVFSWPEENTFCVACNGAVYLGKADDSSSWRRIAEMVTQIVQVPEQKLTLLVNLQSITAWNETEQIWKSERFIDDTTIERVEGDSVFGSFYNPIDSRNNNITKFKLDLKTGITK